MTDVVAPDLLDLSLEEARREYPTWQQIGVLLPGLPDETRLMVLRIALSTCRLCGWINRGCRCWDDE